MLRHIGRFIHKGGVLDELRTELPTLPDVEWMEIETGKKTPVKINVHHTSDGLLKVHEDLAEFIVDMNKELITSKLRLKTWLQKKMLALLNLMPDAQNDAEKINKDKQSAYQLEFGKATEEIKTKKTEFEKERQARIKEIASMRIDVDPRFQKVVDTFLKQLPETPQE